MPMSTEFTCRTADGKKFASHEGWSATHDGNDCAMSIAIQRNGEVVLLAVMKKPGWQEVMRNDAGEAGEFAQRATLALNAHTALREEVAALRERLRLIVPLFQESRDALAAISDVRAKLYRVDLSLANRMDAVGFMPRIPETFPS